MKQKYIFAGVLGVFILSFFAFKALTRKPSPSNIVPTPSPIREVAQLTPDQAPKVSLVFSGDGHYVTVDITGIQAAQLEYNLVYDAFVKNNQINTGVSGSSRLNGKTDYTYKQLLGSESSGHFTYHTGIKNAVMQLTLRNDSGYSVFSANYPFTVSAGKSIDLVASE